MYVMYVCMCVCMYYVCIHACSMYVCTYVRTCGCTLCMYVCMYICMFVCRLACNVCDSTEELVFVNLTRTSLWAAILVQHVFTNRGEKTTKSFRTVCFL